MYPPMMCSASTSDRIKSQLNAFFLLPFPYDASRALLPVRAWWDKTLHSMAAQAVKIDILRLYVYGGGVGFPPSQMYRIEHQNSAGLSHPFLYGCTELGFQH